MITKMTLAMMKKKINLEAEEDGLMKNTSQQGRCRGSRSDTWN